MIDIITHIGKISERNVRKYSNDTTLIEQAPTGKKGQNIHWKVFNDKVN